MAISKQDIYPHSELHNEVSGIIIHVKNHIQSLKVNNGTSQADIARKMGYSSQRLSGLLAKSSVSLHDFILLCMATELNPCSVIRENINFYQDDETMKPKENSEDFGSDIIGKIAEEVAKRLGTN